VLRREHHHNRDPEWIVEGFGDGRLVEEALLLGISSKVVRRIFSLPPGDQLTGPFPVTALAAEALRPFLRRPLDIDHLTYSVSLVEGGLRDNRFRRWRADNDVFIPSMLYEQLLEIPASHAGDLDYRPCQVTLRDGSTVERVYVVEALPYFRTWGIAPEDDGAKSWLSIHEVRSVRESPDRLDARLATKMYEAGESGMGYCVFQLALEDDRRLDCLTGGAVDFIDWPSGVLPAMVRDLIPHAGDARTSTERVGEADYSWCLFQRPGNAGHGSARA
jgi:hypothetical protein